MLIGTNLLCTFIHIRCARIQLFYLLKYTASYQYVAHWVAHSRGPSDHESLTRYIFGTALCRLFSSAKWSTVWHFPLFIQFCANLSEHTAAVVTSYSSWRTVIAINRCGRLFKRWIHRSRPIRGSRVDRYAIITPYSTTDSMLSYQEDK